MGTEYCICPPKLTTIKGNGITRVTFDSPWSHRLAVEKMARYFKRELRYDFVQFSAKLSPENKKYIPYEAYLFHEDQYNLRYEDRKTEIVCGGACCFYQQENNWSLNWVWFHPYFRRRGMLKKAWLQFKNEYGQFDIEEPISNQMSSFLSHVDETKA